MSCPKDTNVLVRDEFGKLIAPIVKRISKCKGQKSVYPSFTPIINSLSVTSCIAGVYTVVTINGSNFMPQCNGETYVNFGQYSNLPIIFYNSTTISFVVPLNAIGGTYNVRVVNIYNNNFSLPVNQSYPGIPNYSNPVIFTIYNNINYSVTGSYSISSDSSYNTIIDFTGNGTFTIHLIKTGVNINYIAVGGGGGGAGGIYAVGAGGGGGGGGEVAFGTFTLPNSYVVLVGAGGNGGLVNAILPQNGSSGSSSQISGIVFVAGGQGGKSTNSGSTGGNSGHGGAGGIGNTNPGGNGTNGGGGGGGAYGIPTGYNGGNGAASTTSVYYYGTSFGAGGGGGGGGSGFGTSTSGIAGNIYAGNGGQPGIPGNAVANYGGGGGGGLSGNGTGGSYSNGGKGGSGRVILYFNS
jgi:hypothetical protein